MTVLVFLDQNAWVALARGAWDRTKYQREHAALTKVVDAVQSAAIMVPLTFANIYETTKIDVPVRRANMARTQALISGGRVFRGRRRVLEETLAAHIADTLSIPRPAPEEHWFLSDLWFESAGEYSPEVFGFGVSQRVIDLIRLDPARALFDFLMFRDEKVRLEAVRRNSENSTELIRRIEGRRALVSGETLALRRRAYGARLLIDELDLVLATARTLGLNWQTVRDLGSSMARSIIAQVPILNVERELVVRLEDQTRSINENDLRDMASFTTVLPFADLVVAEKQFVNLAHQSGLGKSLRTKLITSIFEF